MFVHDLERVRTERESLDRAIKALREFESGSLVPSPSVFIEGGKAAPHDRIADYAAKRDRLEMEYRKAFMKWADTYERINNFLTQERENGKISAEEYVAVRYRFILCHTWTKTAEQIGRSYNHTHRLYRKMIRRYGGEADDFDILFER